MAQGRPELVEGRGAKSPSESERGWGPASTEEEHSPAPNHRDRGAKAAARIIPKLLNEFVRVESRLYDAALNSSSAAVYEADFPQAGRTGSHDVLIDN